MAPHPRSVRDLGLGDHVATDPGGDGHPVLPALARALPERHRVGRGAPGRRARGMVGAGLLQPRAQPSPRGSRGGRPLRRHRARHGRGAAARPWDRSVYGRGHRLDCFRGAGAAGRWQRGAGPGPGVRARARREVDRGAEGVVGAGLGPGAGGGAGRFQPGADGARRDRVHAIVTSVRRLPDRVALRRTRQRPPGRAADRATPQAHQ